MGLRDAIEALRADARAAEKKGKGKGRKPAGGWPVPEALDREEAVLTGRVRRPLVTLRVAAAHFGMSVEGLRRRIHLDGCPHVKVGQELRLDLGKVEAFYGRGTTEHTEHTEGKAAGRRGKMKGGAVGGDRVHGKSLHGAGA